MAITTVITSKFSDLNTKVSQATQLQKEIFQDMVQAESIGQVTLQWRPVVVASGVDFHVEADGVMLSEASAELVARYLAVRTALEAWKSSGGDWPLAKAP